MRKTFYSIFYCCILKPISNKDMIRLLSMVCFNVIFMCFRICYSGFAFIGIFGLCCFVLICHFFDFTFLKSGTEGSIAASQVQGLWFGPKVKRLSIYSFACSPHVFMGFLSIHWFPFTIQNVQVGGWGSVSCRLNSFTLHTFKTQSFKIN